MTITILEARVPKDKESGLHEAFRQGASRLPSQMVETFLARRDDDPEVLQVIGVWQSREALQEYRRSVETPGGVLMFRSVGAEPTLAILNVVEHVHHS